MNLYLIETARDVYATNANDLNEAEKKFKKEYPDYFVDVEKIKRIHVESLVQLQDNDDIIFF